MSYYTSFRKAPNGYNREDQDVSRFSDDLIMPRYTLIKNLMLKLRIGKRVNMMVLRG